MNEYVTRFLAHFPAELTALLIVGGSLLSGWLLKLGLFGLLRAYERRTGSALAGSALRHLGRAAAFFGPVLLPLAPLAPGPLEVLRRVVSIASISTFAWGLMRAIDVLEDLVLAH